MTEHYCILCGEAFDPFGPEMVVCPACDGLPGAAPEPAVDLTQPAGSPFALEEELGVRSNWQVGDVILGTYEVRQIFKSGGMGLVYRVHHRGWNIDLALKSPRPEIIKRYGEEDFIREANTWVELGLHPHIVACYYVRKIDDLPRVFAEFVEGGSLKDWIEDRRLYAGGKEKALERILDIAIQFAWGLAYAHEQWLVHRDVKPANVLMTPGGIAKVTDFGLVMDRGDYGLGRWVEPIVGPEASAPVSLHGSKENLQYMDKAGMMTPAYCSPEQHARRPLTLRTDVWSWAVSVLEMFVGEVTWHTGAVADEALAEYLENGPANPLLGDMPTAIGELLAECFQLDPEQRPRDLLAVAGRLQQVYQYTTGQLYPRQQPEAAELRADSLNNKALSLWDLSMDNPTRQQEAEHVWKEALATEPNHPESTYNLGLVEWHGVKIVDREVVERLTEVCNSRPEDWRSRYLLAQIHLERDDCQAALERLQEIHPEDAQRSEALALLDIGQARLPISTRLLRSFDEHTDVVNAVSLSANGQLALSASRDRTLKLWDTRSGICLHSLTDETQGGVTSACLSQDGNRAVATNWTELKLWDIQNGRLLKTIPAHSKMIHSVCLSMDGRMVLSGSEDMSLKLWDIDTGRCLRTFSGHERGPISVRLSADTRLALSCSEDGMVKLWNVQTGQCLRTLQHERLKCSALSPDGRLAVSAGWKLIKLWDLESGACLKTFEEGDRVHSVCLSADGRFIIAGLNRIIHVWDVYSQRCLRTLEGHTYLVQALDLRADCALALSGCMDKTMKIWAIQADLGELRATLAVSNISGVEIALSGKSAFIQALAQARQATSQGSYNEAALQLQAARAQAGFERDREALEDWGALYRRLPRTRLQAAWCVHTLQGHASLVSSVGLSPDGRWGLTGGYDNLLRLWDLEKGNCLRAIQGHTKNITSICVSADGRLALTASHDHMIKLWDLNSGECLRTLTGHQDYLTSLSWSPDGRFALSGAGSYDRTVRLWEVESGRCLRILKGHTGNVNSVCLSSDARYALSGGDGGMLKYWDLSNGECLRDFKFEGVNGAIKSVYLGLDNRFALVGSGYTALLLNLSSGERLQEFNGHSSYVVAASLSLDGRLALTGSMDNTLKLWDIRSGECLRTFEGHHNEVNSVAISPDARLILSSGGWDKTAKLWFLDWGLEGKEPSDWDEGARIYLEVFLTGCTPSVGALPPDRIPTETEIALAFTRGGRPTWKEADFQHLLDTLGCAGYGWLRPEGVRRKLQELAAERGGNA